MDKSQRTRQVAEPAQPERRDVVGTSALAGASALLGGWLAVLCGDHPASVQSPAPDRAGRAGGSAAGASEALADAGADPDVERLNALLAAEYNAIRAYAAGATWIKGAPASDALDSWRGVIGDIALDFQSQHKMHARTLCDAIAGLNGTPVEEARIAAAFKAPHGLVDDPSIMNVLEFVASAERAAAEVYQRVLAGMHSPPLRSLASSIERDESQHCIVLKALVRGLAEPPTTPPIHAWPDDRSGRHQHPTSTSTAWKW